MAAEEPAAAGTVVDVGLHVDDLVSQKSIAERLEEPHRSHLTIGTEFDETTMSSFLGQWEIYASANLDPPSIDGAEEFFDEHLREKGVDYAIVNAFSHLARRPTTEYATELMRACNDVLVDDFLDGSDDLFGFVELATQRPDLAAEEIDRMADEERIVGALIGNTGMYPPPGDPRYDVIYRAAEDNDFPIVFHPDATHGFEEEFPVQFQGFNSYFAVHSLAGPWTQMLAMTDLIEKGTPEKFPDLDFVFLETDFSIVPYLTFRMNKAYGMRSKQLPLLEKDPETYVRDSFHFGTHPLGSDGDVLHEMVEIVGPDSLLFSTGALQYDQDTPRRFDDLVGDRLPVEAKRQILGGNAEELFGLYIP